MWLARSGYMAPEYAIYGQFSTKSDVFSYGVLVLEIVSGRKSIGSGHGEKVEYLLSIVSLSFLLTVSSLSFIRIIRLEIYLFLHITTVQMKSEK